MLLKGIKELFTLLTPVQRRRFYFFQLLVLLMSLMEIVGVASIIPFMVLVGDMGQLKEDNLIAKAFIASKLSSETEFVFLLGACVLFTLFISAILSTFTIWRLSLFATKIGTEITDRLYNYYLSQSWLFHSTGSSAQLTKKIANEAQRVTSGILTPVMQLNARIALCFFLGLSIFLYNPIVATVGITIFAIAYFIIFKSVKNSLQRNGVAISKVYEERFRLMNESFGGIKDVLLLGRSSDFIERFNQSSNLFAYSQGTNMALTLVPRYFMELIAFGSMIGLLLYLIASHNGNLGVILPIISVYALATFKLLPAFQQVYATSAQIKANLPAFESIKKDLSNSLKDTNILLETQNKKIIPKKEILLKNIFFTYPDKKEYAISNLNISIKVNTTIGLVGPSGSGKSTLIDIFLGLIEPQQGILKIDDTIIHKHNLRLWQNTIGFVPQSIFLSEGTIAENIAFGIPKEKINFDQVEKVLKLSYLYDLVQSLDLGVHTKVGERGVQLSGGQRQRVGIARALYMNAEVIVFDEATSSLDGITEKMIMESIQNLSHKKTIIMIAHRLKTVQKCDKIFFIEKGQISDQGTYEGLLERNKIFRNMVEHT